MIDWAQNKKDYHKFCKQHPEMPVFLQDWWLDVVCTKGAWKVCLTKDKNDEITGVLPFYHRRYFGFPVVQMPDLTPFGGIWLNYPSGLSDNSKTSFEKKVMPELIDQLPMTAYYAQNHPVQITNWLPFYWKGFKQTTRYTYRIEHPINLKIAFANLKGNVRNKIAKAKKIVEIFETEDLERFYQINELTFERQSKKIPYTFNYLKNIDNVLSEKKQRKILLAKDHKNQYHAGIYLVWDQAVVYNLMLGANTDLRNSGAVQLLLWKGIQLAAAKNCTFDFEGSMMPNIESMFSGFGGKLMPYSKVFKESNFLFSVLNFIRNS